VRLIFKI